ncbi:hypothetical protein CAP40_11555 [Sphingomonas sp. IBVSS2]|uniref:ATP-binding cassette domain-containing protein n=1 Tax=Sphingomonas sp. IBVSS2 TaxID=1985172 RepID=UPI000A2E1AD2|nr:ATP-binding cassette domain-containing protein [Sphingomonas sp. IBVSS2]OSZ66504.1 hypothetical protein CAP40_11555 [Sphingomonas sp. IBVSS2]
METALETNGLVKKLGGRHVINGLTMSVPRRAIYGFLGANGAGKTTTIRMILGVLRADAGAIALFGAPLRRGHAREIGALVESPALYDHLTGAENLDLTRRILGLPGREIGRVLALVDLEHAANRRAGTFSLGMRQRLGIARALLGSPRLLILDEPTNGLDPNGIHDMRVLLRRLPEAGDVTLVISSHLLNEIEAIASHVGLLHGGRLLAEGPLATFTGGDHGVEIATADRARAAILLSEAGLAVRALPGSEDRLIVSGSDPATIAHLLHERGERLSHLVRHRRPLEQVYQDLLEQAA